MDPSSPVAPRLLVRVFGVLFLVAGTMVLLWATLLPAAVGPGALAVAVIAAVALGTGTVMLVLAQVVVRTGRLETLAHTEMASAQVLIGLATWAAGDPQSLLLCFSLWSTAYAGCLGRRARHLHVGWSGLSLAATAASFGTTDAWTAFVCVFSTVVVVSSLVAHLVHALEVRAQRDPLTRLPNRKAFAARAQAALDRQAASGGRVVVALVDLDRFKDVNDTYGHSAGDDLLCALAPRLRAALRPGDLLARLGGDEFAVLCEDPAGTLDTDGLVSRLCAVWAEPVLLAHGPTHLSGSIGVTVSRGGEQPPVTPAVLLSQADAAMYRAKEAGPGGSRVFDEGMLDGLARRMELERGLHGAAERGELSLAYQPVVWLDDGSLRGAEALLRWTRPDGTSVGPAEFVPVAEDTGQVVGLGRWVLAQAVADLAAWRRDGLVGDGFVLTVNVSPRQLGDDLLGTVTGELDRHGVPATALGLEVTESALLAPTADAVLGELHALGCRLFLDDFGTGWSSLAVLRRLPFDVLKVDRSFVAGVVDSPQDRALVAAVLSLGRELGLSVVAEGVETAEQAAVLRAAGCAKAQGWLYGRPVPAEVLVGLLGEGVRVPPQPVAPDLLLPVR